MLRLLVICQYLNNACKSWLTNATWMQFSKFLRKSLSDCFRTDRFFCFSIVLIHRFAMSCKNKYLVVVQLRAKFQPSGVPTRDSLSRPLLNVHDLSWVEAEWMDRGRVTWPRVEYREYFLNSEVGSSYSPKFAKGLSLTFKRSSVER